MKKHRWQSYEEKNLVDAVTAASTKALDVVSLRELKGTLPTGTIGDRQFSRLILGGNLLSGWAHSRDLIYVSQLVKAYHNKDRIFATLLVAEKCGVNTLLTNPILCSLIDEYWKRRIGKIQFISDCAGLDYDDKGPHPMPFDKYLDKVQRAIDYGAAACYIQGETADYYIRNGQPDRLIKVVEKIRANKVLVGIGAHHLETVKGCVAAGMTPDFWMKTLHHHGYWSARHPEWHDNMFCNNPDDTTAWMAGRKEPWIAFKVMAAGAIHPKEAFRYAFEQRRRLRVRRHVRLPDGRGREHRARRARAAGARLAAAALDGVGGRSVRADAARRARAPRRADAPCDEHVRRGDRRGPVAGASRGGDRPRLRGDGARRRSADALRGRLRARRAECGRPAARPAARAEDGAGARPRAAPGQRAAPSTRQWRRWSTCTSSTSQRTAVPPGEPELRDGAGDRRAVHLRLGARALGFDRGRHGADARRHRQGLRRRPHGRDDRSHGVRHALVNAGGDIRALGSRANGGPWRVGVQDPRRPEALVEVVDLADAAVATSGDYVRFHDVERRTTTRSCPRAAARRTRSRASASARRRRSTRTRWRPPSFVLGAEAGCRLVEGHRQAECLLLARDGSRRASTRWAA